MPETLDLPQARPSSGDLRYEAILETAGQLIHDRGYHAVSIRDLAAAVGIKMSSLYYYFPSKEQILYAISHRTMDELTRLTRDALQESADAGAADRLRRAVEVAVRFHIDRQAAAGVVLSEARKLEGALRTKLREMMREYEEIFHDLVREGMSSGAFQAHDSRMATYIMLSALTRVSIWYRPGGRLPTDAIEKEYATLLVGMLTGAPTPDA